MTWVSRIASDTLKNLTVECPQNDGKLLIVAPCLASLHIALRSSYYDITLGEAHSLVQASISLVGTIQQQRYWPTTELRALCKLLRALSNVNSLELVGFQEMVSHLLFYLYNCWIRVQTSNRMIHLINLRLRNFAILQMSHMNQSPGKYAPGPMLQAVLDEDNHRLPTFRTLMNGTNLNSVAFSAKHSRA
jgi:hypothetical protein